MSKETIEWLNTNVLVGMTDQRGNAWHHSNAAQGAESNHYPGPIPIADIQRRLFGWQAVPRRVATEVPADWDTMTHLTEEGHPLGANVPVRWKLETERQSICTSDTHDTMGMFKAGYVAHQYGEWLVSNVANILDQDVVASSAGLLEERAVGWVEASMPETVHTAEGVDFRPNLLACTSFNGKLATTYKLTITATVCDNTLRAAMGEDGGQFKAKHSKNSGMRIADARDALGLIIASRDAFSEEIARLSAQRVSDSEFVKMLDVMASNTVDESGKALGKAAVTKATAKRDRLFSMWRTDERVAPWTGTGFGVVQAFNTWEHHDKPTRGGTDRGERNMMAALNGETDKSDGRILELLAAL